jgi:hypothetical protein
MAKWMDLEQQRIILRLSRRVETIEKQWFNPTVQGKYLVLSWFSSACWKLINKEMKQILYTLGFFLAFAGCTVDERAICGRWQAKNFYENGQTVATDLAPVQLDLAPNERYLFSSLGQYREAGQWRCSGSYLILNDSTSAHPSEKILKVLYQGTDSLKLKMQHEGREQVLFLARIQ